MWVPESPHWLIANHKTEQLRSTLQRMVDFNRQDINVQVRIILQIYPAYSSLLVATTMTYVVTELYCSYYYL